MQLDRQGGRNLLAERQGHKSCLDPRPLLLQEVRPDGIFGANLLVPVWGLRVKFDEGKIIDLFARRTEGIDLV